MNTTTAILKPWHIVEMESPKVIQSPSGSNLKIYHQNYYLLHDQIAEISGSKKGYLGIHADYRSMFGRKVVIRSKYHKNGRLNKHQCCVMGNRNKEMVAFTAYDCWFEKIDPISPVAYPPVFPTANGMDITRQTWDSLFEI